MEPPTGHDDAMDDPAPPEPSPREPGDAELIARVRAGDVAAYGILYERHLAAARGLAHQLAGRNGADDAVQDAFTKVLTIMRSGGGPDVAFRPYLLTVVRRAVYDRRRADRRVQPTDTIESYDPGVPFEDPAIAELELSMAARAYLSLPERWRTVLWHTEVENERPAQIAPLLGLTANGVAALAYRAREGLRQAYLTMHLRDIAPDDACRPALEKLSQYVRGALAQRDSHKVRRHLADCKRCKGVHAELIDLNGKIGGILGPLVVGASAARYATASKSGGAVRRAIRRVPKRQQQALAGGTAVVVAAAVALAFMLVSDKEPMRPAPRPPVAVRPVAPPPATPRPPAPSPPAPAPPSKPRPAPVHEPHRERPVKKPRLDPPRAVPPADFQGIQIHIEVETAWHHVDVRAKVRADVPRKVRVRAKVHVRIRAHDVPRGWPRSVPTHVQRPMTWTGGHGRLKARSWGPRH
ncbi:hypothetical protein GCM10022254_54930 [Actinomadura meridiana]|uniref:Sigma-70 family RNA polymerase sigma factor n=1 Tax=Actinomadura meridiana TaxID=559626 RepID=A0ABP8CF62_9ACTN